MRLERWGPAQVNARMTDVMRVYRRAFLDVHEAFPARAEIERTAHARSHLHRPGLRAVAALEGDRLVGVGYGQPGAPGQWWHDVVVTAVTGDGRVRVRRRLARQLLRGRRTARAARPIRVRASGGTCCACCWPTASERTAALSALEPDGSRARRLYTSEGFLPLLSDFRFPGGPTRYAVLAKRLDQ